jgi:hypothetical protein
MNFLKLPTGRIINMSLVQYIELKKRPNEDEYAWNIDFIFNAEYSVFGDHEIYSNYQEFFRTKKECEKFYDKVVKYYGTDIEQYKNVGMDKERKK